MHGGEVLNGKWDSCPLGRYSGQRVRVVDEEHDWRGALRRDRQVEGVRTEVGQARSQCSAMACTIPVKKRITRDQTRPGQLIRPSLGFTSRN